MEKLNFSEKIGKELAQQIFLQKLPKMYKNVKNVKLKFMNIKPKLLDKVESITCSTMEQRA